MNLAGYLISILDMDIWALSICFFRTGYCWEIEIYLKMIVKHRMYYTTHSLYYFFLCFHVRLMYVIITLFVCFFLSSCLIASLLFLPLFSDQLYYQFDFACWSFCHLVKLFVIALVFIATHLSNLAAVVFVFFLSTSWYNKKHITWSWLVL